MEKKLMTKQEAFSFLNNKKVYVNGKSTEIQKLAFRAGYVWHGGGQDVQGLDAPFLFFEVDPEAVIYCKNDMQYFINSQYQEISAEEILAIEIEERPITERVKTFRDACNELGENHPYVEAYNSFEHNLTASVGGEYLYDIRAHLMLRIICAALNEGWEPQFTEDEWRYYPYFWLYTQNEINDLDDDEKQARNLISTGEYKTGYAGLAYAYSNGAPSYSSANVSSRLCLKSGTLAVYCGKQFINLWADFFLVHK